MGVVAKSGPAWSRSARCVVAAAVLLGATDMARAQDFFDFLHNAFGGSSAPAAAPQSSDAPPPLTVRRSHPRRRPSLAGRAGSGGHNGRYDVADIKGVTMYTDKSLSRGDAVMTPNGLKVFNGSSSWPYTDDDFVALSSGKLPAGVLKELVAIDAASKPGLGHK